MLVLRGSFGGGMFGLLERAREALINLGGGMEYVSKLE